MADLSSSEIRILISCLNRDLKARGTYFDNMNRLYSGFFGLQTQLVRLECNTEEDLVLEWEFIDQQIAEWNRQMEDWQFIRWHLAQLRNKLLGVLREEFKNAA